MVTDEQICRVLNAVPKGLLIGGKWISTRTMFAVEDPSTAEVIAEVADAAPEHGIQALDAAVAAFGRLGGHRPQATRGDPAPGVRPVDGASR